MNLVLDDAEEVYVEKAGKEAKPRQDLGKSLLPLHNIRSLGQNDKRRGDGMRKGSCRVSGRRSCELPGGIEMETSRKTSKNEEKEKDLMERMNGKRRHRDQSTNKQAGSY